METIYGLHSVEEALRSGTGILTTFAWPGNASPRATPALTEIMALSARRAFRSEQSHARPSPNSPGRLPTREWSRSSGSASFSALRTSWRDRNPAWCWLSTASKTRRTWRAAPDR